MTAFEIINYYIINISYLINNLLFIYKYHVVNC